MSIVLKIEVLVVKKIFFEAKHIFLSKYWIPLDVVVVTSSQTMIKIKIKKGLLVQGLQIMKNGI